MKHDLKILPKFFYDAAAMHKPFEVRKNDRDYQIGDLVVLHEWDGVSYTGRLTSAREIIYILSSSEFKGISPGYAVLGLRVF